MLQLCFSARLTRFASFCTPLILAVIVAFAAPDSASATGGSWGGSGGFGSGGGSWGGSGGGLFGGRRPIRNLLGRIGSRLGSLGSGGSRGGSFGSAGGSGGGSFGGSVGGGSFAGSAGVGSVAGGNWGNSGSYAAGSSGSAYGTWGSNYLTSFDTSPSYVSTQVTAPVYSAPPVMAQSFVDTSSFMDTSSFAMPGVAGCASCGTTTDMGIPVQQGMIETDYSADTGFYDGSMPSYDSTPSDGDIFDPNLSAPTDYYDNGSSLLDDPGSPPPPGPAGNDSTSSRLKRKPRSKAAVLSVALPADAKVYINGQLTKTEGEVRNYVARRLKAGQKYGYEVKAVINRNGKRLVRTQTVQMKPGVTRTVEMDFEKPATTLLALQVPANAKVRLCGLETSATGERRFFETSKLQDGESWDKYEVEVVVNRDGKEIVARKTLKLHAGDSRSVVFDFQDETGKLVALK